MPYTRSTELVIFVYSSTELVTLATKTWVITEVIFMAKRISRKKVLKTILEQIEVIDKRLAETNPDDTFQERRKVTDKNGNEKEMEVTVCPYSDLLKQKSELIKMYNDLKSNNVSVTEVAKIVVPTVTNVGLFIAGLEFERENCFKFETFKIFLRKLK